MPEERPDRMPAEDTTGQQAEEQVGARAEPENSIAAIRGRLGAASLALARLIGRSWRAARQGLASDGYSPLDDIRDAFGHLSPRRIGGALLGLVLVAYLLSGIYSVQPGEAAVVQRFGRVVAPTMTEGLHYRLPLPIERETIVNIAEVRRESVGLTEPEPEHPLHLEEPGKLQVLSGDTNIVDYEVIVQYQIGDPVAYLFNVDYPPYQLVRDAVRAAVTQLSSSLGVDDILTTERQRLQNSVREVVQALLDEYDSGLVVISADFQKAYPPDEVADAFRDVSSAREDKAKAINEAEGYRNSIIPEARAEANRILTEAAGYAKVQREQATGAAGAFDSIIAEYRTNSSIYGEDVTRYRLYLEAMEQVLPRVQTYVVQPGERVSLRLLNGTQLSTFPPGPGDQ